MKVLSFDTETSSGKTVHGPSFRDVNNDIYTQIFATHPDKVSVVHEAEGFKRQLHPAVIAELEKMGEGDYIVGHNLGFDLSYIWEQIAPHILRGVRIWDTQEAAYCLSGQQHTTASLAELQLNELGEKEKPSRISALYKKGIGADVIVHASRRCKRLFALYEYYCNTDGSTPLKIFKKQYIRAKQEAMLEYIKMRNEYLLIQILMMHTGVKVDIPKAEWLFREYNIKHIECLKKARDAIAVVWADERLPEFKVSSTDHKSLALFGGTLTIKKGELYQDGFFKNGKARWRKRDLMIEVKGFGVDTKHTRPAAKEGYFSTDVKVLKSLRQDKKLPQKVIHYCDMQEKAAQYLKAANTYCKAFIERSVATYLHTQFNNTITPTGRLTSKEPNLQNVPSKSQFADDLMGALIAPEGYSCVSLDFSQLEKWVQAWVTEDLHLTEKLLSGTCLHCLTLANMEGLDYDYVYQKAKVEQDPIWDAKRTNIKPIGFRMDYGGGAKGTSLDLGLDLDFVQAVHDTDKILFPDKYKFFEVTLPAIVAASSTYSAAKNIPANKTKGGEKGSKLFGKAELLPIFDKSGNIVYNKTKLRRVGYWKTSYGQKFAFLDTGNIYKGEIKRRFSMPQFKNYPNQGGGAAVQGATSAVLLPILLSKPDKIKLVLEIHDSKCFYVKTEYVDAVIKWLKGIVEDVPKIFKERFNVDVPFKFPVEFKTGSNFSPKQMVKYGC